MGAVVLLLLQLLFTVATVVVTSTKVIHCNNCAYAKFGNKELGNPDCKHGKSSPVVECNENTVDPSTTLFPGSQPQSIADYRKGSKDRREKETSQTVYGCASAQVDTEMNGQPLSTYWRSCTFELEPKSGCDSGTRKELGKKRKDIAGIDSQLDDNARIRMCICFDDNCNPDNSSARKNINPSGMIKNAVWMAGFVSVVQHILMKTM